MESELAYQQGRRDAIVDINIIISEASKKYVKDNVQGIVETYNSLIQYLHMENSRLVNDGLNLLSRHIAENKA